MSGRLGIFLTLAVLITLLMFWGSSRSPFLEKGLLVSVGIENIEFYYQDKNLTLMVDLNKPLPCSEVVSILGIETIVVKNKIYRPECKSLDASHVEITYKAV